jgi:HSP20 family protein
MSMERWNPFWELDTMRNRLDRLFEDRFPNMFDSRQQSMNLAIDVREVGNGFEIEASLPGFKADDVEVEVNRDIVTLRGKQESSSENRREGQNYIYRERRSGSFFRTIQLPTLLDGAQAHATLDQGVLRVQIPKLNETGGHRLKINPAQGTGKTSEIASSFSNSALSAGDSHSGTIGSSGSALGMSGHSDAGATEAIKPNDTTPGAIESPGGLSQRGAQQNDAQSHPTSH